MKPRVFVGSSTEWFPAAELLTRQLRRAGVEAEIWPALPGRERMDDLTRRNARTDFGLFLLTPDDQIESRERVGVRPRDNVLFELGMWVGAHGADRALVIRVLPAIEPSDIAAMTSVQIANVPVRYRNRQVVMSRELRGALREASERVGAVILRRWEDEIRNTSAVILAHADGDGVARTVTGPVSGSGMEFADLIGMAKRELVLVAQNHNYIMVRNYPVTRRLFSRFLSRPGTRIRMIFADPDFAEGMRAWAEYVGVEVAQYAGQLDTALRNAARLAARWPRRFQYGTVPLVAQSISLVDPERPDGIAVPATNIFEEKAQPRPVFMLTAREHAPFADVVTNVDYMWRHHTRYGGPDGLRRGGPRLSHGASDG